MRTRYEKNVNKIKFQQKNATAVRVFCACALRYGINFDRFVCFQGTHQDSITNSHGLTGIITSLLCGTTSLKVRWNKIAYNSLHNVILSSEFLFRNIMFQLLPIRSVSSSALVIIIVNAVYLLNKFHIEIEHFYVLSIVTSTGQGFFAFLAASTQHFGNFAVIKSVLMFNKPKQYISLLIFLSQSITCLLYTSPSPRDQA